MKFTKIQLKYIKLIDRFIAENLRKPTVREICKMANVSSPATVHGVLKRLGNQGYENSVNNYFERREKELLEVKAKIKKQLEIALRSIEETN